MPKDPFLFISIEGSRHTSTAELRVEQLADFWVITSVDTAIYAKIKKRQAYPGTYCRQINNTTVQFGYGSEDQDEFLAITLHGSSLTIVRDEFAVLPTFYYAQPHSLVLSNEYDRVVKLVEQPVVRQSAIIDHLMMVDRPAPPAIEGVDVLKEQEKLLFVSGKGVEVSQPQDRDWHFSTDIPVSNPKDFFEWFSEYLDYFIESRFSGQKFAFEVSGGLDSATLPQYFHQTTQQPIYMASMLFGAPYASSQRRKLEAITAHTSGTLVSSLLDPATMAPLSTMVEPRYGEVIYLEAFSPLAQQLRELGVQVVATGSGGGEFFQNVTDESFGMSHGSRGREIRQAMDLPSFFTPAFCKAYVANTPTTPILPLPHRPANVAFDHLSNNVLIREDIWPVSPFSSPQVYRYVQSIPAHFRANKNILRAFHQAKGFAEPIYNASENEYFDTFFNECFKNGAYDALFETLIQNARTVAMGYVDSQKVRQAYHQAVKDPGSDEPFRLYCFMALEASLHLSNARLKI